MNMQDIPRTITCKLWVEAAGQWGVWRWLKWTILIPRIAVSHLLFLPSVKSIGASETRPGCHPEPIAGSRDQGHTVSQHHCGWSAKMKQLELQGGLEDPGQWHKRHFFQRLRNLEILSTSLKKKFN